MSTNKQIDWSRLCSIRFSESKCCGQKKSATLTAAARDQGASDDAVSARLRSIPARFTKAITTLQSQCRTAVEQRAFHDPSKGRGWWLVPTANLPELVQTVRDYQDRIEDECRKLTEPDRYDAIRDEVRQRDYRSDQLWSEANFPAREELRNGFSVSLVAEPVINPGTVLSGISEELAKDLAEARVAEQAEALNNGVIKLVDDLKENFRQTLEALKAIGPSSRPAGILKEALRVADRVDSLNIHADPGLSKAASGLRKWAGNVDGPELKNSSRLRKSKIDELEGLLGDVFPTEPDCCEVHREEVAVETEVPAPVEEVPAPVVEDSDPLAGLL